MRYNLTKTWPLRRFLREEDFRHGYLTALYKEPWDYEISTTAYEYGRLTGLYCRLKGQPIPYPQIRIAKNGARKVDKGVRDKLEDAFHRAIVWSETVG